MRLRGISWYKYKPAAVFEATITVWNYLPIGKDGGADKDRTCDLLNAIQALYQLSYDPIHSSSI